MIARIAIIVTLLLLASPGAAMPGEGPQAFFGYVTHYETNSSGRGELQVVSVVPGSPAAKAGILAGDRVLAFNGIPFVFEDEYQYMRSLAVFVPGVELRLELERGTVPLEVAIVPEALSAQQSAGLEGYMASLKTCVTTGEDCPCSMDHSGKGAAARDDFRSPYRRYLDDIGAGTGRSILQATKASDGTLHYSSSPTSVPAHFELGPSDNGMLWQSLERLKKGETLTVEISKSESGAWRYKLLNSAGGG